MKKAFWKKPAALILTVAMMLSLMPTSSLTAWAAPEDLKTITLDEANNQYLYIFDSGYLLTKSAVTSPATSSIGFQSYSESYEISSSPAATTIAAFVKVMEDYTSGGGARTINLKDLHIDVKSGNENCAFELKVGADVNLHLKGNNTLQSGYDRAGLQVPSGARISIGVPSGQLDSSGSLDARSNGAGAGIGGGKYGIVGNITIYGGNVYAYSSYSGYGNSAGIGGSSGNITISGGNVQAYSSYSGNGNSAGIDGSSGNITISGGNVQAYSSYSGYGNSAGIGGSSGNITISGGIINAYSSHSSEGGGAGIGGAVDCDGGNITISGGNVQAYSSYSNYGIGAGIGGGEHGAGGNITISGGTIHAYSSYLGNGDGAGIGGSGGGSSYYGSNGGNITIFGGTTYAYSSYLGNGYGAGIGGGGAFYGGAFYGGSGGNIIISGGNVLAFSSGSGNGKGAGIGGGYGTTINGAGGNITIAGGSILPKATSLGAISINKNPTNGAVNVYLATITLENAASSTVTSITAMGSYRLKDVKADDEGKVYFWLPTNQVITAVEAGGKTYTGIITPAATNTASAIFKVSESTGNTGNTGSSSSSKPAPPKTDEEKVIDLFTDIIGHWAYDDILYVVENEIMNGVSSTLFAPDETMSRAMMATVLYRMEKEPSVSGMANPFDDVVKNQWYTDAVVWGANTDIVKGYSNAVFGVNDNITREQMVTILYRYAMLKGMDVSGGEDTNILSYSDAFSISEYAIPAMQWAAFEGLIKGRTDGTIDPQGTATRAEIAAVLHRFNSISK